MERRDLLAVNAGIFKVEGRALSSPPVARLIIPVVGNPAHTNAACLRKCAGFPRRKHHVDDQIGSRSRATEATACRKELSAACPSPAPTGSIDALAGLPIDDFARRMIDRTTAELADEFAAAARATN
jgi:lactate/malate dehydrogenase, NAD binding domain